MVNVRTSLNLYSSGRMALAIRPQIQANMLPRVQRVASAAKTFAPKKTGRLARSIRVRARGSGGSFASLGGTNICTYEVVVAVPYAGYVTNGTAPHVIRSTGPWPLRNRETGQVFGPIVHHPGTKPNDYLQRALRMGFLRG